jgi:beta-lactamase class A
MAWKAPAADDPLTAEWRKIAASSDGILGVAAQDLSTGKRAAWNTDARFPVASVCKLAIGAHMLALVEEGRFRLDQEIEIPREDLWPGISEVAPRWERQKRFPFGQLLEWMVSQSDNTVVETFYRLGGGGEAITARLKSWKVEGMRIDRNERQCMLDAEASMAKFIEDPRDTATPWSAVDLLAKLWRGELLPAAPSARLIAMLKATTTYPDRIKGLLPPGTVVAHKTGTGPTIGGLNATTNDAGVILRPDGRAIAIAVFLKQSKSPSEARGKTLARASRAAWDAWA